MRFPSSLNLDKKIQDRMKYFILHNETKMMLLVSIATNDIIMKFGSWIVQRVSRGMQMHVYQFDYTLVTFIFVKYNLVYLNSPQAQINRKRNTL